MGTAESRFGEWACASCPEKRIDDSHPIARKIVDATLLAEAGYPLGADDLTPDEWRLTGLFRIAARRAESVEAFGAMARFGKNWSENDE